MKRQLPTSVLVALFCALIVIGLAIVAVFVFRPPKTVAESSWTPVEATVTASGLRSETPQNGPGAGKTVYKPVVTYVYEIDGVRHESPLTAVENHPAPEGVWTQRSAEKAFPRGMKIAAWVDPADPSRSALEPVAEESLDKTWFIGAFVFLWVLVPFGVFVLFPAIRKSAGGEELRLNRPCALRVQVAVQPVFSVPGCAEPFAWDDVRIEQPNAAVCFRAVALQNVQFVRDVVVDAGFEGK